jgi:DedD protein
MDRSTKERLTGAIVLVAVAWLVIPVFLDGPGEDGETARQGVDLPGQEGQPTRTRRIVLEPRPGQEEKITDPPPATRQLPAPGGDGAAAEETPAAGAGSAEPASAQAASASEPEPEPQPEPEPEPEPKPGPEPGPQEEVEATPPEQQQPAAAGSLWAVQLGSFSNEENAEGLAADLRDEGFAAFLSRVESGGRTLHRVRVGPQGSRDEAEKVAAALAKAGQRGQVVTHP